MTRFSKPKTILNYKLYHSLKSTKHPLKAMTSFILPPIPTTFAKAAIMPHWFAAMKSEIQALLDMGTWSLCPRPSNRNIIKNKWVYQVKHHSDGSIKRYKTRLVAKDFQQRDGIDYKETFSTVIKPTIIRILLSLAIHYNWPFKQLDVSNAFLHGHLSKEVFMEQPTIFVDSMLPNHVCKLKNAIYGLKQAPRAWFQRLSQAFLHLGFIESLVNTSLFILHQDAVHMFILIYVDDIIIIGTDPTVIASVVSHLQ